MQISSISVLDITFNFRRPHLVIHQGLGQDVAELHGVILAHPYAIAHRPYPRHPNVLQSSAKLQPEMENRESVRNHDVWYIGQTVYRVLPRLL